MKKIFSILLGAAAMLMGLSSCVDDLDQKPIIGANSTTVYSTIDGYRSVLAKIYGSYSLVGQERASNVDLSSNKGEALLRNIFNLQEAPTDEVAYTWLSGDQLEPIVYMTWDASDIWVSDTYYRLYYSIALCNEFLRYCGDASIGGFNADEQAEIRTYAAEARFMRALSYYFVLDLFRKGPYVDEHTPTSGIIPPAYDGTQLYDFISSELLAIENALPEVNSYGRAGQAALWALGVRLNLNAKVYTGTEHYTECISYAKKIIASGKYSLESDYSKLFNADNFKRTNEIIFAFVADADNATTWGAATYITAGSVGSDELQDPAKYGLATGWGNLRLRSQFCDLFTNADADSRNLIFRDGLTQNVSYMTLQTSGFRSEKWTNLTDDGAASSVSTERGCDTDYPMFRLAEIYLSAAEAVVRGGGGMSRSEALDLVNDVRKRAYGDESGNISDAQMTADFFMAERGRELFYEAVRRSDLIRFEAFSGSKYIWEWKGGTAEGKATDARYDIYPIPMAELSANPNLKNELY